jgi:hypothetical protein
MTLPALTDKQRRCLLAIIRLDREQGRMPTVREISAVVLPDARHHNSTTSMIDALVAKGWLEKPDRTACRAMRIPPAAREQLGVLTPDDALDAIEEAIAVGGPTTNSDILRIIERCRNRGNE